VKGFTAVSGNSSSTGEGVAVDTAGNVYSTGYFNLPTDFDPGSGAHNITPASANKDIYVVKLTSAGDFDWAVSAGEGPQADAGAGIAAVPDGRGVIAPGTFFNTVDFDPGTGTASRTSKGQNDIFLWRLKETSPSFQFAERIGGNSVDR